MSPTPSISVVLPAWNEASRVGAALDDTLGWLERRAGGHEVLVVDDGSTDETATVVARRAQLQPRSGASLRLIRRPHAGKGAAVRVGMLAARGDLRLFRDADASTEMAMLDRLLAAIHGGADVAIGSRRAPGARVTHPQPWPRAMAGHAFTRLAGGGLVDVTCGFKLFRSAAADAVFARQTLDQWAFDAEILLIARRLGLRVAEVPVDWAHAPGSRVRVTRDAVRSLVDLGRIYLNDRQGRYGGRR